MTEPRKTDSTCLFALILMALIGAGFFGSGAASAATEPDPATQTDVTTLSQSYESSEPWVPGEVLVQKTAESTPVTVQVPVGADPLEVARKLQARPGILAASPNFIARASAFPNDPGVQPWKSGPSGGWIEKQWNFLDSPGGIDVTGAWKNLRKAGRPGADGVRIAVIDSGIAYRNYGRGRFLKSPDLKRSHIGNGRDFVDNDRIPLDRYGHGTHIASTIGETTNNGVGLTGIAYRSKMIPVRVLNRNGFGTTRDITDGVRWAANHNVKIAVMSLNFPCGQKSKVLTNALQYAHDRGVVLVASAGNNGATFCPSLPATGPGVIAVGASTAGGCLADYSFRSEEITLTAPGGGRGQIDCPTASVNRPVMQLSMLFEQPTRFGIETRWIGTSMAAAHVAGAAAMVIASDVLGAKRGPRQVRDRLTGTASTPAYAGTSPDNGFGAGIVDVARATDPGVLTGS